MSEDVNPRLMNAIDTLPPLPGSLQGQPSDEEGEGNVAMCPISQKECMLEECAWFNRKSGYCFVTYLCLKF